MDKKLIPVIILALAIVGGVIAQIYGVDIAGILKSAGEIQDNLNHLTNDLQEVPQ